jgi:glycosyltransferase involved in cell wall biosynthesis
MKIAMIGLRGIPGISGGVENVVENLAPRLIRLGCDVTVYCRSPYSDKKPKDFKGVKLKYLPTINRKHTESIVHSFLSTTDSLFKDYDIVHYHAMGNGIFSLIPRLKNNKTVVTLHGLDWERDKWGFAAKSFLKLSERAVCSFPNRVISVSEKIKRYYKAKYNKDIIFIPNGVNIEKPKKISSLKRFLLKKDNYILFLSRIVPEKGIHTLIKAYKNIDTDTKLIIAGDTTHTEGYLKEIQELAKDDKRVILTGPLYGEEKTQAFSNCLFFVLPSTIEGMPIVLLEAMSFGKCPLVSDIEENMDVIHDNGFSFKVGDETDLQKKIEYMLKHTDIVKRKGLECKVIVKDNYGWDAVAKKTYLVYRDALDGKKS